MITTLLLLKTTKTMKTAQRSTSLRRIVLKATTKRKLSLLKTTWKATARMKRVLKRSTGRSPVKKLKY